MMIVTALRIAAWSILWIAILLGLAMTIVPRFLDRLYYEGVVTDHFDGARFFNPDGEDTLAPPGVRPGGSRAGFIWRQMTGRDGRPDWKVTLPVTTSKPAARIDGTTMVATWIGHATVLVQTSGLNILTDPVWSRNAGPFGFGPKRVTAPGVALADLPKIDVILLSHNHYDHMDLKTLKRLWDRDRPLIVTSLGNDAILRSAGLDATAVDWGQAVPVQDGVTVHVTRNHHWGSRWFTDRNRALWSSFVVKLPGGNLFFAGDTGMGDGQWPAEAAALGRIRLALLPIGAFRFTPGQMGTGSHIGPVDAVEVFRRLGASRAIPIHWGTFRLSYEAWDTPPLLLDAAMRCYGQTGFDPVAIGQSVFIGPALPRVVPPASVFKPDMSRDELLRCLDTPEVRALR